MAQAKDKPNSFAAQLDKSPTSGQSLFHRVFLSCPRSAHCYRGWSRHDSGSPLLRKIKKDSPKIHIAMLTGYDLPEYRQAATQFGADGFFVKESLKWDEVEALVKSIESN